jgi:putative spermidine/putrescine transport system ATP-binding protein
VLRLTESATSTPVAASAGDVDESGSAIAAVDVRAVRKTYGELEAVAGVDLEISRGEFFTLLGPSGSGKTTLLRIIAGFTAADSGQIRLGGVDVTREPPFARNVNTVFQDYALFPHMNVYENVEYGMRVKRIGRRERRARAQAMLEMVRLPEHGNRKPAQLSGGQRQRVALARSIANQPEVLLLDEPLGALDLKLRQEMQLELKRIQREIGITFIFVTHDQEEALTMSDRVAVMNNGRIAQIGIPVDVYERPADAFVAGFIGVSNLLDRGGRQFTIRPEKIVLIQGPDAPADGYHSEPGRVTDIVYLGSVTRYVVELESGETLIAVNQNRETVAGDALLERGSTVAVRWREDQTFTIDTTSAWEEKQEE